MILNQAKNICFGEKAVLRIIRSSQIIWDRGTSERMPVMNGVTGYFTENVGVSADSWRNQVGSRRIAFDGLTDADPITHTGESVLIPHGRYGTFYPKSDEFPEEFTIYSIARSETIGGLGQFFWSNYHSDTLPDGSGVELSTGWRSGVDLAFRSIAGGLYELYTSYSGLHFQICAMSVRDGTGRCFVNGTFIGEIPVSRPMVNLLHLGRRAKSDLEIATYSEYPVEYQLFAFAETAHTDAEILRNMGWLTGDETASLGTWDALTAYRWNEANNFTWSGLK